MMDGGLKRGPKERTTQSSMLAKGTLLDVAQWSRIMLEVTDRVSNESFKYAHNHYNYPQRAKQGYTISFIEKVIVTTVMVAWKTYCSCYEELFY